MIVLRIMILRMVPFLLISVSFSSTLGADQLLYSNLSYGLYGNEYAESGPTSGNSDGIIQMFQFTPTATGSIGSVEFQGIYSLAPNAITSNAATFIITDSCCLLTDIIEAIPVSGFPDTASGFSEFETFNSPDNAILIAGQSYWWGLLTVGNEYIDVDMSNLQGPVMFYTPATDWQPSTLPYTTALQINSATPEPTALALLLVGIAALFIHRTATQPTLK